MIATYVSNVVSTQKSQKFASPKSQPWPQEVLRKAETEPAGPELAMCCFNLGLL